MKTQIEKLISIARDVANAHKDYRIIGEIVKHTPNIRINQLNKEEENEFTSVYFEDNRTEVRINFSNYRGVTIEFNFHEDVEKELDLLIAVVEESATNWLASYPEQVEQKIRDAVEKRKELLIKLTNELNEMEGKL